MSLATHTNGASKPPRPPVAEKRSGSESYHGIPVMELHVGDAIPTPRAPGFWVIRVYPDLARYLITMNVEHNRRLNQNAIVKYGSDMLADRWVFTPELLVFTADGKLADGQHRLSAVAESGTTVHMLATFGWPIEVIYALDRGRGRTNGDGFTMRGIPSASRAASIVNLVNKYDTVRGGSPTRQFSGLGTLSTVAALAVYEQDPSGWDEACRVGTRVYQQLDKSLSEACWGAAHRIIARTRGADLANAYMDEIREGTGAPRSATRTIADFYRRRPVTATKTGDSREPLENIIRGFNAWRSGKTVSLVSRPGFELSAVR